MTDSVNVPDTFVWMNDTVVDFEVPFVADSQLE